MNDTPEEPQRGQIGQQIFEQVEAMVAAEGITRQEAFNRLSEETGRRAGTVAANYYRIARMRGTSRPRRRGRPRKGTTNDVETAISALSSALDDLVNVVRRQERELSKLQEQSEQLDKLKRVLKG
ncbi:MAG: hypothetical protein H6531_07775 [Actinobacteria bacterium]|nr:hypothetical protein [Thermoleophilia bacterium]MCB9011714.1 hypothetical protein [Actinomycetota bacterium]